MIETLQKRKVEQLTKKPKRCKSLEILKVSLKEPIARSQTKKSETIGFYQSFKEQNDLKNEFKKIGEDLEESSDEELFTKKAVKLEST